MEIKKYKAIELFSVVDGRLATDIGMVYQILNHVCNDELYTHHLPVAMEYIKMKNPKWLNEVKMFFGWCGISEDLQFEKCIDILRLHPQKTFNVPQLKDEFDTSDFIDYMLDNSLLLKRFK